MKKDELKVLSLLLLLIANATSRKIMTVMMIAYYKRLHSLLIATVILHHHIKIKVLSLLLLITLIMHAMLMIVIMVAYYGRLYFLLTNEIILEHLQLCERDFVTWTNNTDKRPPLMARYIIQHQITILISKQMNTVTDYNLIIFVYQQWQYICNTNNYVKVIV